jgi:hypothetical protein
MGAGLFTIFVRGVGFDSTRNPPRSTIGWAIIAEDPTDSKSICRREKRMAGTENPTLENRKGAAPETQSPLQVAPYRDVAWIRRLAITWQIQPCPLSAAIGYCEYL